MLVRIVACAHPIPTLFHSYIQPGAVLDPNRILVGSRSIELRRPARCRRRAGGLVPVDQPERAGYPERPAEFRTEPATRPQPSAAPCRCFSANSPHWLNGVNNFGANTASYTGVSNPLGLSNNNASGRL